MFDQTSVKKLVDNQSHVLYVKNGMGQLEYYSLRPDVLVSLLNQVYLNAYSDAFEQSDAQSDFGGGL